MISSDRRRFLKLSASAGAAAAVAGALPQAIAKALSIPADRRTGTLKDVDHVVILMQENRSFDHYFGSLRGVRGFGDPRPLILPGGHPVWCQPRGEDPNDYLLPFRPPVDALGLQFVEDLPHGWNDTHNTWHEGRYDRWVPSKGSTSMAYMVREDIPFHYALADAFTICDAYHCSMLSSTDPNRYYMWTGYAGNDGSGGGPVVDNAELGYDWITYPERLEQAGIGWKIYQDIGDGLDAAGNWGWTGDAYIGNYGDNSLLYFNQYRHAVPGSPLYEKARTGTQTKHGEGLFDQLRRDVAAGTLPSVSWVAAPEAYSEHPNWPANYGAWYIAQVLEALTSNPQVWSRTALFITYDENDGFFDHVPPPFAPVGTAKGGSTVALDNELFTPSGQSVYQAGPYGLGPRVPMIVVSPWSQGGWVCSQVFDHTSILQFLEQRFGVVEPHISPWRRAVCGDLTAAFDFTAKPSPPPPALPDVTGYAPSDRKRHENFRPTAPLQGQQPVQEPGQRPARALPYALAVHGQADAQSDAYRLTFANEGAVGASFLVSSSEHNDGPRSYTVEAGKQFSDLWTYGKQPPRRYALSVLGPNGFLREFQGSALAARQALLEVQLHSQGDQLSLLLINAGDQACTVIVQANAYQDSAPRRYPLAAGSRVTDSWQIDASGHWYDLSVRVEEAPDFLRRLAGHVENGRPSVSDPAFGKLVAGA